MTVHELNADQLLCLKQAYLCNTRESVSWGELADAGEIVSDRIIYDEYACTDFSEDDFC